MQQPNSSLFGNLPPAGIPLSQFTNLINNTVNGSPSLSGVWVIAELSDVRTSGGHCYMELIEKDAAGQTVAKLRANIWRSTFIQLRQKFYNATQKDISTGIKALVRGSANHHSVYGMSFNIFDIDPSYTMGDMERLRREILMRLNKEGVAMLNKSRQIPMAPQKIAVISAQGAAGYGDFINHLCNNSEGFVFYPCLFPCVMQGDRVSESIRQALLLIESTSDMWDCVAIVRGGGATTDLNGFDDYELARAVATCGLPVVVGIGHDRDRNVLDEIANTSLKTPTAVAGFFIDKAREAYDRMLACADKIRVYSGEQIRGEERRLSHYIGYMPQLALLRLEESRSRLRDMAGKIPVLSSSRIQNNFVKLQGYGNILRTLATNISGKYRLRLENYVPLIQNLSSQHVVNSNRKIKNLETMLSVLDPINTLKRGYSVTRINGKAVKSLADIKPGDKVSTTLPDGNFTSTVDP